MSLFNNPMVKNAEKSMTDEQKNHYKKLGEDMYNHVDFEKSEILSNNDNSLKESAKYIYLQIRSGLHPSYLEENEKDIMSDVYGKGWFRDFGYNDKDLTEVDTYNYTIQVEEEEDKIDDIKVEEEKIKVSDNIDYQDIPEITFSQRRELVLKQKKEPLSEMEEGMLNKSFFQSTLIVEGTPNLVKE